MIWLYFIKYERMKAAMIIFQTSDDPAFVTINWFPWRDPLRLKTYKKV
jgi:hypothetical protein